MQTVILVIHILASIAMIAVVLMQRSEGGALGIGGGGGGGGLMSGRGAAGALVRTTMIFGGIFFVTSLTLTTIAAHRAQQGDGIERRLQDGTDPASTEALDPDALLFPETSDAGSDTLEIEDPLAEGDESTQSTPPDPLAAPEGDAQTSDAPETQDPLAAPDETERP